LFVLQGELKETKKELDAAHSQQEHTFDEQNNTMAQMKAELAEAITGGASHIQ
jgi:hypothetical protein